MPKAKSTFKLVTVSAGPIYSETISLNNTLFESRKGAFPMSLVIAQIIDDAVFIAADTRSSQIDNNGNQLSFRDDYRKIVPSSTGKILLASTNLNALTTDRKSISEVMHDIDTLWLQCHKDAPWNDIGKYVDDAFERYLEENYQHQMRVDPNIDRYTAEKIYSSISIICGFVGDVPIIRHRANMPSSLRRSIEGGSLRQRIRNGYYVVSGSRIAKPIADARMENAPHSQTEIVDYLESIFEEAKRRDKFVGGDTVIYKMSFVNGKERIERIV